MIDTHCHIDAAEFDGDREDAVEAARAAGVDCIVVPSVARDNFGAVASVCRGHPQCRPAWGIHPMYVDRARDEDLVAVAEFVARAEAVAVGEIGLDRFVESRDDARQARFFAAQLGIAREADLPVLLHVRRAVDAVLVHLRRTRVVGGIAHAFNGSIDQAQQFIKLGFKLGFGGAMTHPRAHRLRELAATLPLDALVLETDSPDIPPAWLAGGRNSPAELPRIAAELAGLRGISCEDLIARTTANALAVLPRLASSAHGA